MTLAVLCGPVAELKIPMVPIEYGYQMGYTTLSRRFKRTIYRVKTMMKVIAATSE